MNVRLVIYGNLQIVSGGYRYDRELVAALKQIGHDLSIHPISRMPVPTALVQAQSWSSTYRDSVGLFLQDELCHRSLIAPNLLGNTRPAVAIVHHLRASEQVPQLVRPFVEAAERAYLTSVDGFVFNSRATHESVELLLGRQVEGVVAPPAWSGPAPVISQSPSRPADSPAPLRILFAANLIPRKRLDSLLKALAMLPRGGYLLRVAGSPLVDQAYSRKVARLIAELGLSQQVKLLGSLSDQALGDEYRVADVVAVPSQHEGFGRVYLEAHAYGVPVIAARNGGASQIVSDGVSGWLVDPDDPAQISDHLRSLAEEPGLCTSMGNAGRQRFDEHPTWPQNAERIDGYLKQIVSSIGDDRSTRPQPVQT